MLERSSYREISRTAFDNTGHLLKNMKVFCRFILNIYILLISCQLRFERLKNAKVF